MENFFKHWEVNSIDEIVNFFDADEDLEFWNPIIDILKKEITFQSFCIVFNDLGDYNEKDLLKFLLPIDIDDIGIENFEVFKAFKNKLNLKTIYKNNKYKDSDGCQFFSEIVSGKINKRKIVLLTQENHEGFTVTNIFIQK